MTRVIILTSTFLRHQYVVNYLAQRMNVVGVWQEEKSFQPLSYADTVDDEDVISRHFMARDEAERVYFGQHDQLRVDGDVIHRKIAPGKINDPAEVEQMLALKPTLILVYGTGLIKKVILEPFSHRIINIHLGLSPYYRGSGTNFWPLVNREPEYVGATIHYLDEGIDTGPILAHTRPKIEVGDGSHDIGNKTIQAAAKTLAEAALVHESKGMIDGVPQIMRGRLYQRKDFSADAVQRLYHNFETGMIEEYLADKERRDSHLKLVSLGEKGG